jgi:hypothetical protein
MMPLRRVIDEDQRLILLRALCEADGGHLNETILMQALHQFGHTIGRDKVRTEAVWLESQSLVRIEKLAVQGGFWVVHICRGGEEIVHNRRVHPGVAIMGVD